MSTWSSVRLDALTSGYLLAFVVGVWFSVASWLFAYGRAHGPRGGLRPGGRTARLGRASSGKLGRVVAPLCDPSAWAAFLGVGGGVGYIARLLGATAAASLAWALPAALAGSYVLRRFVSVLERSTRFVEPFTADGTVATVLSAIGERTIGQVLFLHAGCRRSLPAASESGRAIQPGTEVIVVRVERGIAKVAPTSEVMGEVQHVRQG
jgi:hypothetical protein